MKRIVFFLIVLFTGTIIFAQKKVTSDTSRTKTPDIKITAGASGVRRSIGYRFSSTAADADPGNGLFRYNNPAVSKVTWIFVDNNDISGEDQTNWYSTWNDTTGATARGSINIVEYEGKNVNIFNVTGVFIKGTGYWKIPVEYISGTLPVNGATYYYVFNRIAHKKPQPVQEPGPITQPPVVEQPKPVVEPPVVQEQKPVEVPPVVQEQKPAEVPPVAQEQKPAEVPPVAQEPKPVAEPPVVQEPNPGQKPPVIQPEQEQQPAQPAQTARKAPATRTNEAPHPVQTTQPATTAQPAKAEQPVQTTQPAQQAQQPQQPQQTQTTQTARNAQNYPPEQYNQPTRVARPVDVPNPYADANLTGTSKRKCYRGIIELGYALGVGNYGSDNFRFNFINGIMIGRFSSIGLGLGYRRYFEENFTGHTLFSPKSQIPVFLDLRTSFSTRKVTPYLALGIGGSASIVRVNSDSTSTKQEGLFFCPSGGIWFNVSDRFAVFAGIAYEMQRLEYVLIADNSHFKKNASSLSLNIGIAF